MVEKLSAKTRLIGRAGHTRTGPVDSSNVMRTSSTASSTSILTPHLRESI
jgi:hypothetical protein